MNHCHIISFEKPENKAGVVGTFYFDDLLEKIVLKMDDGTYIATPADNVDEPIGALDVKTLRKS